MFKVIVFFLAIGAVTSSPVTPVRKCKGTNEQLFKQVVISTPKGVCTKLPCEIIRGKEIKSDITFQIRHEVKEITLKCNATALGVTTEYPVPNASKGCDMLTNTHCPVSPDTEADLTFHMNVAKIFPKVNVDLVFYMLDDAQRMISCFEVTGKIEDAREALTDDYSVVNV